MKKTMIACVIMIFNTNIKSSDHSKNSLDENRRDPVVGQVVGEQRNEARDMLTAMLLASLIIQNRQEDRNLDSNLQEIRNPFFGGMLDYGIRLDGFGFGSSRRMQIDVDKEERETFMQGLRNLPQEDKDLVLRLMDEEAFSSDVNHSLAVMEQIDNIFKKNRLRRYGDYTTIRFVLKGEQESRSEDGEKYAQREIAQGLGCNVFGEISQSELERKAHRQEFEEFVAGLKAMSSEDRDAYLGLLDNIDFDTDRDYSKREAFSKQADNILNKNKIRRVAGTSAVRHILENEKKRSVSRAPIKMPSLEVLKERLSQLGQDHFNEKTNIAQKLADKELKPLEVAMALDLAYHDYFENLKSSMPTGMFQMTAVTVSMNKPLVFKVILQDHPAALEELKKAGVYKPIERQ